MDRRHRRKIWLVLRQKPLLSPSPFKKWWDAVYIILSVGHAPIITQSTGTTSPFNKKPGFSQRKNLAFHYDIDTNWINLCGKSDNNSAENVANLWAKQGNCGDNNNSH
jgi:hypothetical protein